MTKWVVQTAGQHYIGVCILMHPHSFAFQLFRKIHTLIFKQQYDLMSTFQEGQLQRKKEN
jgi:hypothetical protein